MPELFYPSAGDSRKTEDENTPYQYLSGFNIFRDPKRSISLPTNHELIPNRRVDKEKAPAMLALLHLNSSRIATKKIEKEKNRP
jgi:hypothetical protein